MRRLVMLRRLQRVRKSLRDGAASAVAYAQSRHEISKRDQRAAADALERSRAAANSRLRQAAFASDLLLLADEIGSASESIAHLDRVSAQTAVIVKEANLKLRERQQALQVAEKLTMNAKQEQIYEMDKQEQKLVDDFSNYRAWWNR